MLLEGLALPMLLLPPQYTPNVAASWALLQDTTFFLFLPFLFSIFFVIFCDKSWEVLSLCA